MPASAPSETFSLFSAVAPRALATEYAPGYMLSRIILSERNAPLLFVARDDKRADAVVKQAAFFRPEADICFFPAWDCLPYERLSPSADISGQRVRALARLAEAGRPAPDITVTTVNALLQRVPHRKYREGHSRIFRKGAEEKREDLLLFLAENGFRRVPSCYDAGEFAVRGGVIDIIPPGAEQGIRLDMFGDEIERIRFFDTATQISTGETEVFSLLPAAELMQTTDVAERFGTNYHRAFGLPQGEDPLYDAARDGRFAAGAEHYLPLFYDEMQTLADYLPPDCAVYFDLLADRAAEERLSSVRDYYEARAQEKRDGHGSGTPPMPPEALYLTEDDVSAMIARYHTRIFSFGGGEGASPAPAPRFDILAAEQRKAPLTLLKDELGNRTNARLVICCFSDAGRERMRRMLQEENIPAAAATYLEDALTGKRGIAYLALLGVEHGFRDGDLYVLSEQDITGERIRTGRSRKRKAENYLKETSSLAPGELTVHEEHGIGRFIALETIEAAGTKRDCLKLEYKGGDILYVPVEQIALLSHYGGAQNDNDAALDRLGQTSWQKRRAALKNRIRDIAAKLLEIAGRRQLAQAPVMTAKPEEYERFCKGFPYIETDDQQAAIDETLADLAAGKPMDRLICGDVGFGKTEVALRAAFAVSCGENPHQTVVVAPTTLLARQHLATFKKRFANTGAVVAGLSRLTPAKEAANVRKMIKEGKADIIVGTHALLARTLSYDCLGLVIVDEEQLFGVSQKERLKELRSETHMLSMSATPIPRTLQMSMSGIKELSLITTPPADRLEIRTYVAPFDRTAIRNALMREHYRGGSTFFVTPRISEMDKLREMLAAVTPELRVAFAHGQMPPQELDEVVGAFYDGAYDVLLSTNIVGSGIDLPSANTMIVHRADMFGLSQLYQMRGRVGRGKARGYAYFLLPEKGLPNENAAQRLQVLHHLDRLGAGMTVATHDMDMRGFGNLLGDEQSGHIKEVGIELYQDMLKEAVEALKALAKGGEPPKAPLTVELRPGADVYIPGDYVKETSLRMGLYRRIGFAESEEELRALEEEMADRFGSLPAEAEHLLICAAIKLHCRALCIIKGDIGPKGCVFTFDASRMEAPERIAAYVQKNPVRVKIKPGDKLVCLFPRDDFTPRERLYEALAEVKRLAAG